MIKNAIEASPACGRILIKTSLESPGTIRLDVSDTGPGIPEAIRDRIFDPLVTNRADGAGLGLGVSRRAVEEYGGSLLLERTGAAGTTMTVRLPICQAPPANQARAIDLQSPLPRPARSR